MNNLKKIRTGGLLGEQCDCGSPRGDLARHFQSEVTLLYVNELAVTHTMAGPLGYGISSLEATRAEHIERRQKELDEFGGAELNGVSVKRVMRCGDPAQRIVEHSRRKRI